MHPGTPLILSSRCNIQHRRVSCLAQDRLPARSFPPLTYRLRCPPAGGDRICLGSAVTPTPAPTRSLQQLLILRRLKPLVLAGGSSAERQDLRRATLHELRGDAGQGRDQCGGRAEIAQVSGGVAIQPRLMTHIDDKAIAALTEYYAKEIAPVKTLPERYCMNARRCNRQAPSSSCNP